MVCGVQVLLRFYDLTFMSLQAAGPPCCVTQTFQKPLKMSTRMSMGFNLHPVPLPAESHKL